MVTKVPIATTAINTDTVSPRSITILPSYRCNASCEQCCFESNPRLKHRLELSAILQRIDEAAAVFPDLELVVFSGGEVFLLKDDLFAAIAHAHAHGFAVRCVTNAFWGKRPEQAHATAERLRVSGCSEVNISTGLDHQRWVDFAAVEAASSALVEVGLSTLVTIESDAADSHCLRTAHPRTQARSARRREHARTLRNVTAGLPKDLDPYRWPGHDPTQVVWYRD